MGKRPHHFQSAMKGLRKPFAVIFSLAMAMSSLPVGALEAMAEELEAANEGMQQTVVLDAAAASADAELIAQAESTEELSVESQEESVEAASEETAEDTTLTYEDDVLVVTVTAAAGVLPAGARVEAEEIHPVDAEKADAYGEALSALSESLRKEDKVYSAAKVYDIRLIDADGVEFEPNGQVSVKLDYKQAQPMGETSETVEVAHLDNAGELQMMGADVATNADGEVETAEFTTDSFSYYIVFGRTPGSTSEPANIGDYGWIKFATNGKQDTTQNQTDSTANWGYYPNDGSLPALGSNEAYRRILQVNLHVLNNGAPETDYENSYTHAGAAQYFWTWDNTVRVDDFDMPDYEVLHTHMHTAWDATEGDHQNDSLIDTYAVRGYQSSDNTSSDLNVLDVYVKAADEPTNAMRYIIRYVHADGSISDGNVRYMGTGESYSFNAAAKLRENDEVYSGMSVVTGMDAITAHNSSVGTGTIEYNDNVDLVKVYLYYKNAPTKNGTTTARRYDKQDGDYYTGATGLYNDKSVEAVNGREFLVNLEAWYVDQAASVGMVLDASGSMAWTAGVPVPIQKTSDEWDQIFGNHNWATSSYTSSYSYNALSDAQVQTLQNKGILDTSRCDNSSMGYNGYHYYIRSNRQTIGEYVALGYTDGSTSTIRYNNTNYTFFNLGDGEGYANRTRYLNSGNAGWYYVNSSGNTGNYLAATGKSYDGIARINAAGDASEGAGPSKFYIDSQGRLCCIFSDGRKNAAGTEPGSGNFVYNTTSPVYEKRETMFTKMETLQDAISQFGGILLGQSPQSQIGMTRFSQNVKSGAGTFDGSTEYLPLMNWTSDTERMSAALDQAAGSYGRTSSDDNGLTVYEYGLTGQTRTWTGVQAYIDYLSNLPGTHANAALTAPNHKYVIIFTDGKDTNNWPNSNSTTTDANDTGSWGATGERVRNLKRNGYTVITVLMKSLAMDFNGEYPVAKAFLEGLADSDQKGNKLYFEASSDDAHGMVEKFREIANYINTGLQDYSIRDYIDPRFDVINEAGDVLSVLDASGNYTAGVTNGYRSFTTPDGKSAYLGYDSAKKMFYVLWRDQDIPKTDIGSTEVVNMWKSSIRLQAKDDFLGGDDMLTNGNEPGNSSRPGMNSIFKPAASDATGNTPDTSDTINNPFKDFPFATADVATELIVDSYEDTVFAGTNVSPYDLFQKLDHTWTEDELAAKLNHEYKSESYFDYLARLGAAKRGNAQYYINIVKAGAVPNGYAPLKDADNNDIESITVSGDTLTMKLPYFYLPKPSDNTSYAGGAKHQADQVGELTYTWKVVNDGGITKFTGGKIGTNVNQNNQLRYDLTVNYVPADFSRGEAQYQTDNGSTRTRKLTGLSAADAKIRDNEGTTAADQNEEGVAVIHVVDGRIALEKRINKKDLDEYLESLGNDKVTFTYALNVPSGVTAPANITFELTKDTTYTTEGNEAILFSGTFAGSEDSAYVWTQLPAGDYSVTETISDSGAYKEAQYAGYTYNGADKRTSDYAVVSNFLASQTGTVTVHLGSVYAGMPSTSSYVASFTASSSKAAPTKEEVVAHYVANADNTQTDKPKRVDPELAENHGKDLLNAQIGAVKITNELKKVDITIEKQDKDDQTIKLEGVTFTLKRLNGEGQEVAVENGTQTTSEDGRASFTNLSAGTYKLYEDETITGYAKPSNPWTIVVKSGVVNSFKDQEDADVATTGSGTSLAYVLKNKKSNAAIEITKVAAGDQTTTLDGVEFVLKKADGTQVGEPAVTKDGGVAKFEDLEPGDYVISETSVPTGWTIREDIAFNVAEDGVITLTTEYANSDPMKPTLDDPDESKTYPLTIPNSRTYVLPAAGGPGVYPFLLAGAFAAAYAVGEASDERRRLSGRKASRRRAAGPLGGD